MTSLRTLGILALAVLLGWSGTAGAHAQLTRARPPAGGVTSVSPRAVTLWFNEQPEVDFSAIQVLDAGGRVVGDGALARTRKPNGLKLALPAALPPGRYVVRYRVLSVDGHIVADEYTFDVGPGAAP
ncbi:MAG: copper resistance protein CopC [Gammaproteobacteria bacterium]